MTVTQIRAYRNVTLAKLVTSIESDFYHLQSSKQRKTKSVETAINTG